MLPPVPLGTTRSERRRFRRPWWRRHPWAAAVLLAGVAAAAWSRLTTPLGGDHDRYHRRIFTCVGVVDGDTLDIAVADGRRKTTRIRLWGVDAPETAGPRRETMFFGEEARDFTSAWAEGRPIWIELAPMQPRDIHGRLLAYVYSADRRQMLNEQLLEEGLAYADRRFAHPRLNRFIRLEQRARRESRGLWQAVTRSQMPAWRQRYEPEPGFSPASGQDAALSAP